MSAPRVPGNEFARLVEKLRDEHGRPMKNSVIAELTFPYAMARPKKDHPPKQRDKPYAESHISNVRNGELPSKQMAEAFEIAFPKLGFLKAYKKVVGSKGRGADGKAHLPIDSGRHEANTKTENERRHTTKLASDTRTLDGTWHAFYEVYPLDGTFEESAALGQLSAEQEDEVLFQPDPGATEGGRPWTADCIVWDSEGNIKGVFRSPDLTEDVNILVARLIGTTLIVGMITDWGTDGPRAFVLARDRDRGFRKFREAQEKRLARSVGHTVIDVTDERIADAPQTPTPSSAAGSVTRAHNNRAEKSGTLHPFPGEARQRRRR